MSFSKYAAKPTIVDGRRFASKAEARRFCELTNLERAGIISGLTLQPRFTLIVGGQKVCTYVGDFSFFESGKYVVEDVKGYPTPEYKLKRKLLLALNPTLDHREIGLKQKRKSTRNITAEVEQIFREAGRRK